MANDNPVRRQHYVQRAYLSHFSSPAPGDKGGIWVYDKKGTKENSPRLQALTSTGIEKDIYTVRHPEAESPDVLETEVFTKIENTGYPVLKQLATEMKPVLTPEMIGRLSGYLAAAHLRVPRNIDAAKQMMEGVLIESLKETARDAKKVAEWHERAKKRLGDKALTPEQIKDMLGNPEKHITVKADRLMALLLNMQTHSSVTEQLALMRWTICDTNNPAFVTGDAPLIVFAKMGGGKVIFGGGFGLRQIQVHFPISPTRCLFLHRTSAPAHLDLEKNDVAEVNRRCIAIAERFVFAPSRSENLRRVVEKYKDYSAGQKVDRVKLAAQFAKAPKTL